MTIDKAISNRTTYLKNGKIPKSSDDYNATLLSIEALKRCSDYKKAHIGMRYIPMLGETEE